MYPDRNEDQYLKSLFQKLSFPAEVIVPPGDDCAVFKAGGQLMVVAVDQVVEGTHYLPKTAPGLIGRKLLARNLSDLAAMGASPLYALVSSATDASKSQEWLSQFHDGIIQLADQFQTAVIGGDLAGKTSSNAASLTIIGTLSEAFICRRSTASAGEVLMVTGSFGNSFLTEHHLNFIPRIHEGCWLAEQGYAKAMIDVSDGLLKDAARLADASSLSLKIDENSIPRRWSNKLETSLHKALTEGEDYELLFTCPQDKYNQLLRYWPFKEVKLTCIGLCIAQQEFSVLDHNNRNLSELYPGGYDHF